MMPMMLLRPEREAEEGVGGRGRVHPTGAQRAGGQRRSWWPLPELMGIALSWLLTFK